MKRSIFRLLLPHLNGQVSPLQAFLAKEQVDGRSGQTEKVKTTLPRWKWSILYRLKLPNSPHLLPSEWKFPKRPFNKCIFSKLA